MYTADTSDVNDDSNVTMLYNVTLIITLLLDICHCFTNQGNQVNQNKLHILGMITVCFGLKKAYYIGRGIPLGCFGGPVQISHTKDLVHSSCACSLRLSAHDQWRNHFAPVQESEDIESCSSSTLGVVCWWDFTPCCCTQSLLVSGHN